MLQYEWNNEGEKELPEEEVVSEEIEPVGEILEERDVQEDEEDNDDELEEGSNDESGERRLELSEPGYDLVKQHTLTLITSCLLL